MNILHLLQDLNIYGGTPKKILDLGKYSKNNHHIYTWYRVFNIYDTNKIIKKFSKNNINVHENYVGRNIFKHINEILKIVKKNNIQIIHSYFYFGEFLGYVIKKILPDVRFIISFVGSNNPNGLSKFFLKKIYNSCDIITYNSNYTKNSKITCFPCLRNNKNFVLYNGIDFPRKISDVKINISTKIKLLSIGGLIEIKNHIILIEAIKILKNISNKKFELKIAGDGPLFNILSKYIVDNNLKSNIKLLGYSNSTEELIKDSMIYLHPCYKEGFGISVLEAMKHRKIILASNAGALPELIKDNHSGYLISPFDSKEWASKLLEISNNINNLEHVSKNAFNDGKKYFSLNNFVNNHDNKLYW